jgi:hypothetical protein
LAAFCFHENCPLVVIISRVWGVTVLLCFLQSQQWLNTIHIMKSLHNGATKVTQPLRGYWRHVFLLHCALQTFGVKTLSQAYALVRINLHEVG